MIITYNERQIPFVWHYIEPFIQRALDRGSRYTEKDIYDGLRKSSFQLWTWQEAEIEAVLVTAIFDNRCLLAVLSGKNYKNWIHALKSIESWAKGEGCESMIIHGRKGWARLLGYEITGRDELDLYILEKRFK